jgi:hypothetical protein
MRRRRTDIVEQLKALDLPADLVFAAYAAFGRRADSGKPIVVPTPNRGLVTPSDGTTYEKQL